MGAVLQGSAQCEATEAMAATATTASVDRAVTSKKGVGLAPSMGYGATQLHALNVSWFYSWSLKPKITVPEGVEFVPIVAREKHLQWSFNEPDHANQANLSVSEALALWPEVVAKLPSGRLGSPAMAGNPVTGSWFPEFMAASPQMDFIAVHWYKGARAEKFISDIQEVIDTYQKPVWVTEFAPQTIKKSEEKPNRWSQEEVNAFIYQVVAWMERHPQVERYAWHDSKSGSSCLYDATGGLSATGRAYAAARSTSAMGAACATETLTLPLTIAQRQDELCHRLDRLNLSESLAQEAARRARLQALAFDQLLSLPELSRQLCLFWGLKTSRAFAALARSSASHVRRLVPTLHRDARPDLYVLGGCLATTELASAQHYSQGTGSWKLLPPMPTERRWCAGAALRGQLYVIGGQQEGHVLYTAERFDVDAGRWESLPDMPTCREACAVAACGSYVYVLGGCQHHVPLSSAERLDVEHLHWETLQDMPCSRDACCAASLGGRIYVMGGRSSGHFLSSADMLRPIHGSPVKCRWSRLPHMPTARLGCFAAAAGSSVYVAGGHAGGGRALAVIERFDVAEYTWELLTEMPSARLGAVSLCWQPSQMVGRKVHIYIFGGHDGQGAMDVAERLQLDSDGISNPEWETLPPLITPCYACAGAVLAW